MLVVIFAGVQADADGEVLPQAALMPQRISMSSRALFSRLPPYWSSRLLK